MKKERIIRSGLLLIATALVACFAFLAANSTSASALDGASGGGASGGGGGSWDPTGGWQWTYANDINGLRNASGIGAHGGAEAYVKASSNPSMWENFCLSPNLVRVYWIRGIGSDTYAKSFISGGLAQPWNNPAGGDAIDQFSRNLAGRGVYVICVVNSVERRSFTESEDRGGGDSRSFTSEYSWSTTVNPELNTAAGVDPIGVDNLNVQPASTTISNFGNVYNAMATSGSGNYDAKVNQINAAIAADASAAHSTMSLNANNRAGLAEGGVLSVAEQTTPATISLSQGWTERRTRTVTCDFLPGTWTRANPENCDIGGWSGWSEVPGSRNHSVVKTLASAQNTGFWQILSVHCNPNELTALTNRLNAVGGTGSYSVISQTAGVDGSTTTVLQTQHYANRQAAVNARTILGVAAVPSQHADIARSSQLGFYNKECDLQCTTSASASSGASTANGALANQNNTTNSTTNTSLLGGALYEDDYNANYLEVFRDNENRTVSVNVAYPVNNDPQLKYGGTFPNAATGSGTITRPAAAPVSTTVTRWAEGTPNTVVSSAGGGQFIMDAIASNGTLTRLFNSSSGTPATQTNWAVNPYQSPNSTTLSGFYRDFNIKSTWASESERPQVLNVKWEYRPTVWTRFPASVGFTANNNAAQLISGGIVTVDQAVDGRCYAQYGTSSRDLNLSDRVQASTGSGTTNTLDAGLVETPNGDNSWTTPSNLVIKFIRGVGE